MSEAGKQINPYGHFPSISGEDAESYKQKIREESLSYEYYQKLENIELYPIRVDGDEVVLGPLDLEEDLCLRIPHIFSFNFAKKYKFTFNEDKTIKTAKGCIIPLSEYDTEQYKQFIKHHNI